MTHFFLEDPLLRKNPYTNPKKGIFLRTKDPCRFWVLTLLHRGILGTAKSGSVVVVKSF